MHIDLHGVVQNYVLKNSWLGNDSWLRIGWFIQSGTVFASNHSSVIDSHIVFGRGQTVDYTAAGAYFQCAHVGQCGRCLGPFILVVHRRRNGASLAVGGRTKQQIVRFRIEFVEQMAWRLIWLPRVLVSQQVVQTTQVGIHGVFVDVTVCLGGGE